MISVGGISLLPMSVAGIGSDDRHWRAGYAQALQDVIQDAESVQANLVTSSFQFFTRLAAVFAEEVGGFGMVITDGPI